MVTRNTQKPERNLAFKHNRGSDPESVVAIHSVFYTIQGEGPLAGHPALFIRLAGCNLQCPNCDTDYTSTRTLQTPEKVWDTVVATIGPGKCSLVVLTGGEPLRQDIDPLVTLLVKKGMRVQVETNGTLPPIGSWPYFEAVTIVCSPKTQHVNKLLEPNVDAYKYVLDYQHQHWNDGLPTLALCHPNPEHKVARPTRPGTPIYVQPEDSYDSDHNRKNVDACINVCQAEGYILGVQMHKIVEVE